jgi:phosphopantothenoylcysteine decarboxylase/phosphopantothenate--cysteine ligase
MCAAVADYKPAKFSAEKIKKREANLFLELTRTRDILASLPKPRDFLTVGFAAETSDLKKNAKKKLQEKHLDMIVANDVSRADVGMESADNEVTILFQNGEMKNILRAPKTIIARELIKIISNMREKRLTKKS